MTSCPVCGEEASSPVIEQRGYFYVRCRSCRSVYLDPMPSPGEVTSFYQNPAYFEGGVATGYRSYADMHKALAPHFRRRLQILARTLPRRGALLDFGCADGFFLELARAEGWEVAGVELSRQMAAEASRKLGVPVASSLADFSDRTFDAITLWEVVEHLPEPISELQRLRERLQPGGSLMLSTPNAGHWQAVRAPERWTTGYQPPAHLILLTADSLRLVLKQAGFEHIQVWKTAPLPPLPEPLRRATGRLERSLADGTARPWKVARALWRAVRLLGWGWQKVAHSQDDIFATLEAIACRPN